MIATKFSFRMDVLERLECPASSQKQIRFRDLKVQGLALRITPNGSKTYVYYRRLPSDNESPGKICEINIGKFEDLKLEKARSIANEYNHLVGKGQDPSLKSEYDVLTYDTLFERYIEEYAKLHTITWQEAVKNHKRYFGQWASRKLDSIRRDQIQSWLNSLATTNGKHTANRNFNTFRAVFTWAIGRGMVLSENPCAGVKTFKTQARERFLQPGDEFERFAKAVNSEPNETLRDFFWMCLFTGARCSNVLAMEWSQISLELQQWRIPITKNNDSQTIPLTLNAMDILRRRKRTPDAHPQWVFPTDRKGWKTGDKGHIVAPRKAFMRIAQKAGIEDLRIHDLRRTAGSYMAMQNVSPTIIGKALGHRSPQATAIYARLTQDPVRQALENAQAALADPTKLIPKKNNLRELKKKHQ